MGIGKKGKRKGRGRPIGSYKGRYQLDSFQEEIRQKLEEGQTMNAIAGSLNVHFYTVQIYVKRHPELIPENYQKRSLRGHGKL